MTAVTLVDRIEYLGMRTRGRAASIPSFLLPSVAMIPEASSRINPSSGYIPDTCIRAAGKINVVLRDNEALCMPTRAAPRRSRMSRACRVVRVDMVLGNS